MSFGSLFDQVEEDRDNYYLALELDVAQLKALNHFFTFSATYNYFKEGIIASHFYQGSFAKNLTLAEVDGYKDGYLEFIRAQENA